MATITTASTARLPKWPIESGWGENPPVEAAVRAWATESYSDGPGTANSASATARVNPA